MSAECAALIEIGLAFALCRTFGANFNLVHYPGLTAGPTIFRAFGARPYGPKTASCKAVYGSATACAGRPYVYDNFPNSRYCAFALTSFGAPEDI